MEILELKEYVDMIFQDFLIPISPYLEKLLSTYFCCFKELIFFKSDIQISISPSPIKILSAFVCFKVHSMFFKAKEK